MAFSCSKMLLHRIFTNSCCQKHFLPLICGSNQFSLSAVYASQNKLSRAMKAYLKKAQEYDEYMKEQIKEFELGKEHLANIMGRTKGSMTQEDIDEAIEYLLPSGLFVPSARPAMKPPQEILKKVKPVEFDSTGRPFHFLFYTSKPNFSQLLHDGAVHLDNLNNHQNKALKSRIETTVKPLVLAGSEWLSHTELEALLDERLYASDYEKYLELFQCLADHPYSQMAETFIKKYRKTITFEKVEDLPKPVINNDGSLVVTIPRAQRDTAIAKVIVKYPGTGIIKINGQAIDYFTNLQCREQVLFPLIFTEMESKVDIEATVSGGGFTSQAGAIRYGISRALQGIVLPEVAQKMKVAGLLQRDFRRRERKKPGQEGARRKYTWLKR